MSTITVQQGLTELKTLDGRIHRAISDATFVGALVKDKISEGPIKDKTEFSQNAQSSLDKIEGLISRRAKVKAAIVASNASTEVNIGDKTMTVAEAIERKDSIDNILTFKRAIDSNYERATRQVDRVNGKVEQELEEATKTFLGKDGNIKDTFQAAFKAIQEEYESKKAKLFDPKNAKAKSESLMDEYETFVQNVDYALTVSNVMTTIEVAD